MILPDPLDMILPIGSTYWQGQFYHLVEIILEGGLVVSTELLDTPLRQNAPMESTWDGRRLAEVMKAAGVSQTRLAQMMQTSTANVSRWLAEKDDDAGREPKATALYFISDALGVSCEVLRQPVGEPIKFRRKPKAD